MGKKTLGKNQLRVNKIAALGYLGKVLLWAASPLNEHGPELDGHDTYNYNTDYAKRAAEALGECLQLVESGKTQYSLAQFDYSDVYNHKKSASAKSCYSDIFYTTGQNWLMPGSTEAIFRGPSSDYNGSNWNFTKTWGTKVNSLVEHDNVIHMPTASQASIPSTRSRTVTRVSIMTSSSMASNMSTPRSRRQPTRICSTVSSTPVVTSAVQPTAVVQVTTHRSSCLTPPTNTMAPTTGQARSTRTCLTCVCPISI